MIWLIALAALVALLFAPYWWVRAVLRRYGRDDPAIPGTGAELARHLVERFELHGVKVELTEQGDHYDPTDAAVRLSQAHYAGRSLAAVAVAAHEVGHAMQHHRGEALLAWRARFAVIAQQAERISIYAIIGAPVVTAAVKYAPAGVLMLALGLSGMLLNLLVHLLTLPVEWDASFGKALPVLEKGDYLPAEQMPAVKTILLAAACTYAATALSSLLNVSRWLWVLRGRL